MEITIENLRKVLREGIAHLAEIETGPLSPAELEKLRSIEPEDPSSEKYWDPASPEHDKQWNRAMQMPAKARGIPPAPTQAPVASGDSATNVGAMPRGNTDDTNISKRKSSMNNQKK